MNTLMNALTYLFKMHVHIANYVKNTNLVFYYVLFICIHEYTHKCTHCFLQIMLKVLCTYSIDYYSFTLMNTLMGALTYSFKIYVHI